MSFGWDTVEDRTGSNAPTGAVVDFYAAEVGYRRDGRRNEFTTILSRLKENELLYHIFTHKTKISLYVSIRNRRTGTKLSYTDRDIKAVDPKDGEVRDGFILRINENGKRVYFKVTHGKESPCRPGRVPKLPKGHFWIWKMPSV